MKTIPLILASSSPRRRQLLLDAGYQFTVLQPQDINEDQLPSEPPELLVRRLALAKAQSCARQLSLASDSVPQASGMEPRSSLVVGCDTVAECSGQILGKPTDKGDARRMLALLRGREHRVLSGLCLWHLPTDQHRLEIDITRLIMARLRSAMRAGSRISLRKITTGRMRSSTAFRATRRRTRI